MNSLSSTVLRVATYHTYCDTDDVKFLCIVRHLSINLLVVKNDIKYTTSSRMKYTSSGQYGYSVELYENTLTYFTVTYRFSFGHSPFNCFIMMPLK